MARYVTKFLQFIRKNSRYNQFADIDSKYMRVGGNPEITEYSFKCKIAEVPAEQYSIKVVPGTKEALKEKFGKDASDKVREAIAKLLEE
jgi:hypothetical protein